MFGHYYLFGIQWCFWDLPAFLLLAVALVFFLVHRHKQKKREDEFAKELEEAREAQGLNGEETVVAPGTQL